VFTGIGKFLIAIGLCALLVGLLLLTVQKTGTPGWLNWFGNLPLDFSFRRENLQFFFPLGSSIVLSLLLSLALFLINKFIH